MPDNAPPTNQAFINKVVLCGWADNHLIGPGGASKWLKPVEGAWDVVGAEQRGISREDYDKLKVAAPQENGTFLSGGKTYALFDEGTVAVAREV